MPKPKQSKRGGARLPNMDANLRRIVEWAASLTDDEIQRKDNVSLSYLYALRHAARVTLARTDAAKPDGGN